MGKPEEVDSKLMRALNHPLRVEMLRILSEQTASPKMMSQMLGQRLNNVSYHTDVLFQYECIEEVKREPRRGGEEHFYRAKPSASLGARSWGQVPAALKGHFVAMSLESFSSRVIQAVGNGAFKEGEDSIFSWQPITVDELGWQEIREILDDVEVRIKSVTERNRRRLGEDDGISLIVAIAAVKAGEG